MPWLIWPDRMLPWSFDGYGDPAPLTEEMVVAITPAGVIATLAAGYQPLVFITRRLGAVAR